MWQAVALVHGDDVRDTIAGVDDDTCSPTGSVEREDSLDLYMKGRRVESFEYDLSVDTLALFREVGWRTHVIFSRFCLGLRGASVSSTGCSSGATRSSL